MSSGYEEREIEQLVREIEKVPSGAASRVDALVAIGADAVPPLVEALTLYVPRYNPALYPDQEARKLWSQALLGIGRQAVKPLLSIAQTGGEYRGATAAHYLELLAGPETVDLFVAALAHPDAEMRTLAARLLGKTGDRQAVEPLLSILSARDEPVVAVAIQALEQLKDPRATVPLMRLLRDPKHAQAARLALEEIG